ncbi:MAG: phosphate ABC transporter ATP-binding protein [Bacteroidetes bacterium]|nr:phosphate ABC transporter ATP-binding protein [Bacteroidota bacterium]
MKEIKIRFEKLNVNFGPVHAIKDLNLEIVNKRITCLIGPSGCGKTTLLKTVNRLNELKNDYSSSGRVLIDGIDVLDDATDIANLRRKAAMVFQKPALFAKSVFENVAFPLRLQGIKNKTEVSEKVEIALKQASVWDEVKDRLDESAFRFSLGQQQRITIARAMISEPEILMLDEPTGSLDPFSTKKIEDLIYDLRRKVTVIMVSHNLQQVASLSDYTVLINEGTLVEANQTIKFFTKPEKKLSEEYLTGRIKV